MKTSAPIFIVVLLLFLTSCNDPAELSIPTDSISDSDLEAALNSDVTAILDPQSLQLDITWSDRFTDESAFGIEQLNSETWQRIATLPVIEGTGTIGSWSTLLEDSGEYRVVADKPNYSISLHTSSGNEHLQVAIPASSPTIVIDSDEPLSGVVTLSLMNAAVVNSVDYFLDLESIASSTQGDDFPVELNCTNFANGTHLITALASTNPGVYLDLRLQTVIENPDLTVNSILSATFGQANLDVTATANIGIESVESFIDGTSLGVLTSPNFELLFRWSINTVEYSHGQHTLRSVAIDRDGNSAESVLNLIFDQFPVLNIDSPVDGAIVSGTLFLNGSFSDDTTGTSVTAHLGDVPVLVTTESPFSTEYNLDLVTPGAYTLTVLATDSTNNRRAVVRSIVIEAEETLASNLVATNATLMAADNGQVLIQRSGGSIYIHSSGGSETLLPDTESIDHAGDWQLSHGHAAVFGQLNGHPNPYHVFLYGPDAQRRNLSEEVQSTGTFDLHPVTQWPWIVWSSKRVENQKAGTRTVAIYKYFLMNLETEEVFEIAPPAGTTVQGNFRYSLSLLGGDTRFYFWASTSSDFQIFYYSTATQTSTQVTTVGRNIYTKSDNERVAWELDPSTFMVGPADQPQTAVPFTSLGTNFLLCDGILAWKESDGVSGSIIIDDGTQTTLSLHLNSGLYDTGGGHVIFMEQNQLKVWDREYGSRTVLNTYPAKVEIDGDDLFIQTSGGSIYQYDLR